MTQRTEPPDLRRHLRELDARVKRLERTSDIRPFSVRPKSPAAPIAVTLWRNTHQSIPDATETAVSFSTALEDNDGMWDSAAPTQFTVRTAGYWVLWASAKWAGDYTGQRSLHITVTRGGTPTVVSDIHDMPDGSAFGDIGHESTRPRRLQAGDIVKLVVLQQTIAPFGPQNLQLLSNVDYSPLLGGVRLGA